jgi:AraC-like DNA-binding protein
MQNARGQIEEVEAAVEAALARGGKQIDDVAQILFVSRSTLQRRVAPSSFTDVRQRVQLRLALASLQSGRDPGDVANEVVLSRDHLRILVKEATGLTPAQIMLAVRTAARLRAWKEQVPPPSGTYAYRRRIYEWDTADRKLQDMLGDIKAKNPLAPWAKRLLLAVQRPDNRLRPNRESIYEARREERKRRERLRESDERQLEEMLDQSWADIGAALAPLGAAEE